MPERVTPSSLIEYTLNRESHPDSICAISRRLFDFNRTTRPPKPAFGSRNSKPSESR